MSGIWVIQNAITVSFIVANRYMSSPYLSISSAYVLAVRDLLDRKFQLTLRSAFGTVSKFDYKNNK